MEGKYLAFGLINVHMFVCQRMCVGRGSRGGQEPSTETIPPTLGGINVSFPAVKFPFGVASKRFWVWAVVSDMSGKTFLSFLFKVFLREGQFDLPGCG